MGRSMTIAQLFPCFTKFLIIACPPKNRTQRSTNVSTSSLLSSPKSRNFGHSLSTEETIDAPPWLLGTPRKRLFELPIKIVKTPKSSNPVLSATKPWFSQGFSHFWPIALEFCSAHATRCMAPAALFFASRTPNRVVFRVARVIKTLGFCMSRSGTDSCR
jgi:hypothetical protein